MENTIEVRIKFFFNSKQSHSQYTENKNKAAYNFVKKLRQEDWKEVSFCENGSHEAILKKERIELPALDEERQKILEKNLSNPNILKRTKTAVQLQLFLIDELDKYARVDLQSIPVTELEQIATVNWNEFIGVTGKILYDGNDFLFNCTNGGMPHVVLPST